MDPEAGLNVFDDGQSQQKSGSFDDENWDMESTSGKRASEQLELFASKRGRGRPAKGSAKKAASSPSGKSINPEKACFATRCSLPCKKNEKWCYTHAAASAKLITVGIKVHVNDPEEAQRQFDLMLNARGDAWKWTLPQTVQAVKTTGSVSTKGGRAEEELIDGVEWIIRRTPYVGDVAARQQWLTLKKRSQEFRSSRVGGQS